jgi:hypothetical protein
VDEPFLAEFVPNYTKQNLSQALHGKWIRCGKGIAISEADPLVCEHVGEFGNGTAIADFSFYGSNTFGYYEVQILAIQEPGYIFVGMADRMFDLDANVGKRERSFALHGNDGRIFFNFDSGDSWGPRFREGDIIGCGYTSETKEAWFTYNGQFLGVAFAHNIISQTQWCPAVGLGTRGNKIRANFGASPFAFNFHARTFNFLSTTSPCKYLTHLSSSAIVKVVKPASFDLSALAAVKQIHGVGLMPINQENTLLFAGVDGTNKEPHIRLINTSTWASWDPTTAGSGTNPDFQAPDFAEVLFEYDGTTETLYCASICTSKREEGPWRLLMRQLDCNSWKWSPTTTLQVNITSQMLAPTAQVGDSSPRFGFWLGCFWTWHPLGPSAWRVDYKNLLGSVSWEEVPFEGAVCRRVVSSAKMVGPNRDALLVSGGKDSLFYFPNTLHFMELAERDGKPCIRCAAPRLSSPCVPRPRIDPAIACTNLNTLASYGGMNSRNVVDSLEIWTILPHDSAPQAFGGLLESGELSDIQIMLRDNQLLKAHKIILHARSTFFRNLLSDDPTVATVDLTTYSRAEIMPLIRYVYEDDTDNISLTLERSRPFLEQIVSKLTPEHSSRIFECLFSHRIASESTFNVDFSSQALNVATFSDVSFELIDPVKMWKVSIPAHKAIICARSKFFHSLCLGGLKESKQEVIQINEVSPDAFSTILRFLYSNAIDFNAAEHFIVDVLKASFLFDITELKSLLETTISQSLSLQNVGSLFLIADLLQAVNLRQACKSFILENSAALLQVPEFIVDKDAIDSALAM